MWSVAWDLEVDIVYEHILGVENIRADQLRRHIGHTFWAER